MLLTLSEIQKCHSLNTASNRSRGRWTTRARGLDDAPFWSATEEVCSYESESSDFSDYLEAIMVIESVLFRRRDMGIWLALNCFCGDKRTKGQSNRKDSKTKNSCFVVCV
jgi:hypothetical protein